MADMVMSQITDDMRAWAIRLSREGGEYDRLARLAAAEERGEKRGWKKGRKEGRAEGIAEGHAAGLSQGRAEGIAIGEQRGLEKGERKKAIDMARSMIADNFPYNTIAKHTGLSLAEIQALR